MMAAMEMVILLIVLGGFLVFVVGLVAVLWAVLARRAPAERGALQVAAERYARGEIDHDQYEQIKRDLAG